MPQAMVGRFRDDVNFFNLYHVMIASLLVLLGPPASSTEWINCFTQYYFIVSGNIFLINWARSIRAKIGTLYISRFVMRN
jgi:hypothetical protein